MLRVCVTRATRAWFVCRCFVCVFTINRCVDNLCVNIRCFRRLLIIHYQFIKNFNMPASRKRSRSTRLVPPFAKKSKTLPMYRSMSRGGRVISSGSSKVYSFQRTTSSNWPINVANGIAGYGAGLGLQFSLNGNSGVSSSGLMLNSFLNTANLVLIFDEYRIKCVDLTWIFTNNSSGVGTPSTGLPLFLMCEDRNDSTAPTLLNMQNRSGVMIKQFGESSIFKKRIYPHATGNADAPSSGNLPVVSSSYPGAEYKNSQWFDTRTPVAYNGFKVYFDPQGLSANVNIGTLTLYTTYTLEFRGLQ